MKSRRTIRLIIAAILSFVLLFVSYCLKNSPKPMTGRETSYIKKIEKRRREKGVDKSKKWYDSLLMVNTCFDLDLVDHCGLYEVEDPNGVIKTLKEKEGKQAITNRKDLFLLLKQIKDYNYRYILLDVQLDDLPCSSDDSSSSLLYADSLKNLIMQMERICVPRSELFPLDKKLYPQAGWADYRISYKESGFIKYPLLKNEMPSMALKAYDKKIYSFLDILYFDKLRLCQNSVIVQFSNLPMIDDVSSNPFASTDNSLREEHFFDLAFDLWKIMFSRELVENKIILIGDFFSNDIHNTFAGQQPGVMINANAYINLMQGKHLVNWWVVLLLFIVYYVLSCFILSGKKLAEIRIIGPLLKPLFVFPLVKFLVSFISFWLVFLLISCCLYSFADYYYSIWLPSLWFSALPHFAQYYQELKSNRKKQEKQ